MRKQEIVAATALLLGVSLLSARARAQGNYEIQVYG
jgi:hypothetical protein